HRGITLEAPGRASIVLTAPRSRALVIRGVPEVRVKGFRFRDNRAGARTFFITARGHCPGVALEDLDIQASDVAGDPASRLVGGIELVNLDMAWDEQPILIRRCEVRARWFGIIVVGPVGPGKGAPCRGVLIHSNRISGGQKGILLMGSITDAQVTGNLVWGCSVAGIQIEDPASSSGRTLIANNTIFDSGPAFR